LFTVWPGVTPGVTPRTADAVYVDERNEPATNTAIAASKLNANSQNR